MTVCRIARIVPPPGRVGPSTFVGECGYTLNVWPGYAWLDDPARTVWLGHDCPHTRRQEATA